MSAPSDVGQSQGDAPQRNASDTPIDTPNAEGATDHDAAAAAVDEMVAAEQGEPDEDAEPGDDAEESGGEPDDTDSTPGDDDADEPDDDGSDDDDAPPKKLSASVREAHRRQRSAARKLAEAQQTEQRNADRDKSLNAREQEWTTFEAELKRNPLQAIAGRMGITVPRLIAAYGEDAKGNVPEAVSQELSDLRAELQQFRDEGKAASEKRAQSEKDARYQAALNNDAKLLSTMVETDEVADRYPYYSALPADQRAAKARALQDHIVKHMPNPGQYSEDDLLEALDAKEKDRITRLEKAGVIKWLGRKKKTADDDAGEPSGNGRRPRTPSAKKAASAAPKHRDMTDEQLRRAAAKKVDELRTAD